MTTEREEALGLAKEAGLFVNSPHMRDDCLVRLVRLARATIPTELTVRDKEPKITEFSLSIERPKEWARISPDGTLAFFDEEICRETARSADFLSSSIAKLCLLLIERERATKPAAQDSGKASARLDWLIDQLAARLGVLDKLSSRLPELDLLVELDKRLKPAAAEFERECADADKICVALGLTVEQARTEDGSLNVPKIINHIQETLAALKEANAFGVAMVNRAAEVKAEPVAWWYEHDGCLDKGLVTFIRWIEVNEPWSETALFTAAQLSAHGAEQFLAGQQSVLEGEPFRYHFMVNRVHEQWSSIRPPEDAYDKDTLLPLYRLKVQS